jgi:hypothetical protein
MILLSRRSLLAIAAVVDIALHARPLPVSAKILSARHTLPPRHLETMLQALVRAGILKGVRGPRGGYEIVDKLARELAAAAKDAGIIKRLDAIGVEPLGNTPTEFAKVLAESITLYTQAVKISGAKVE